MNLSYDTNTAVGRAPAKLIITEGADGVKPLGRCDSCGQNGWEGDLMSPTENRSFSLDDQAVTELDKSSKLQIQWDRTMCKELKLNEGYASVHVLLIRWADCDWPEDVANEISDLEKLFKDQFGYSVQVLSLRADCSCNRPEPCSCSPQTRLDRGVTTFVEKYGGHGKEDNLIILYHTGHGTYDLNLNHLELHGRAGDEDQPPPPKAIWNHTEKMFIEVARCDILTIMDSCFAGGVSAIVHGEYGRTYEYLGATKADKTTPRAGPKSFTRALINSLKILLKDRDGHAFTTHDLQSVLSEQHSRKGKKGVLVPRSSNNSRRIELRPLVKDSTYFGESKIHSYLNLRIELKDGQPSQEEMDELARRISRAVRESSAKTRRVDLMSLEPRVPPSWKKAAKSVRFMHNSLTAFGAKSVLNAVAEDEAARASLGRPGLYASVGWLSPHFNVHGLTLLLYRPWSVIFAGSIGVILLVRILQGPGAIRNLFTSFRLWVKR